MAGTVNIEGTLSGLTIGTVQINVASIIPNSANDYQQLATFIHSGNNTVAIPTWAVGMIFIPPSTNASTLAFQVTAGDVDNFPISPSGPFLFSFPATPPASFAILAGADVTGGPCAVIYF